MGTAGRLVAAGRVVNAQRVARLEAAQHARDQDQERALSAWWLAFRDRVWTEADRLAVVATVEALAEGRVPDPAVEAHADRAWAQLWTVANAERKDRVKLCDVFRLDLDTVEAALEADAAGTSSP